MFTLAPVFALAAVVTAFLYIPLWSTTPLFSFAGDLVVVLYLLLIPTLTFFLGGWYSRSIFSTLGAVRSITQLFAYEIPLLIALLSPALLAEHLVDRGNGALLPGAPVALADQPDRVRRGADHPAGQAGAGALRRARRRRRRSWREASRSTAAVTSPSSGWPSTRRPSSPRRSWPPSFSPSAWPFPLWLAVIVYLAKVAGILFILALLRTVFARLRMDQMINFCWRYVAPIAFLQVIIDLVVKEFI